MIRPLVSILEAALSPFERASEIIFGILMAISVTAAAEITQASEPDVGELAIAALGCNLAWGLIDGVIFLLHQQFERFQRHRVALELRATTDDESFRERVRAELPQVVGSALTTDAYAALRRVVDGYDVKRPAFWEPQEFVAAGAIALLVFLSTLPLVIPFLLMEDAWTALRFSHGVAVVMLFVLGWRVGKWAGASPGWSGTVLALVGAVLAVACVALGG
jgi:VIT1/CCC1 family predicted Fe2+/Mn2+ transporter